MVDSLDSRACPLPAGTLRVLSIYVTDDAQVYLA